MLYDSIGVGGNPRFVNPHPPGSEAGDDDDKGVSETLRNNCQREGLYFHENKDGDYEVFKNDEYAFHDNYYRLKYKINELYSNLQINGKYYKYFTGIGYLDPREFEYFSNFINYVLPTAPDLLISSPEKWDQPAPGQIAQLGSVTNKSSAV